MLFLGGGIDGYGHTPPIRIHTHIHIDLTRNQTHNIIIKNRTCDRCHAPQRGFKQLRLVKAPPILVRMYVYKVT